MKQTFLITLIFSLGLIVSACSEAGSNEEKSNDHVQANSVNKMSDKVNLSADASNTDDGRVLVTGKTNLPDNTELLISLSNESIGFTAQDNSIVNKGAFSAGPLGQKAGLSAGNYMVTVMMPVSGVQPDNVQSIVGNEGQYLTGPLVKDSIWGGKIVEYSFPYAIGSKESIKEVQSKHAKLVLDVTSRIEKLLEHGYTMEHYRNTDDLSAAKICVEKMRKNQAEAIEIRSKAEKLPMKYFDLKVASIDVYSCVSCSKTANDACEHVAESL